VAHFGQSFACPLTSSFQHGAELGQGTSATGNFVAVVVGFTSVVAPSFGAGGVAWVVGRMCVSGVCGEVSTFSSRIPATRSPLTGTCCCTSSWEPTGVLGHGLRTPARAGSPGRWKHEGTRGQQQRAGPLPQSVCAQCRADLCLFVSSSRRLVVSCSLVSRPSFLPEVLVAPLKQAEGPTSPRHAPGKGASGPYPSQ
jgi:hypothetical protein